MGGAIIAGAALALSLYVLLALLGGAVIFSLHDKASAQGLGTGTAVYAIVVTAICLFLGGLVASQLTTGENKLEASLYGIFVWATVFAALLVLTTAGAKVGFLALSSVATAGHVAADHTTHENWEASARQAGVPQDQIDQWKQRAKDTPATAKQTLEDPQNQKAAEKAAKRSIWFTFMGVWISMMAAAAGGYVGGGPTFELFTVTIGRDVRDGRRVVAPV